MGKVVFEVVEVFAELAAHASSDRLPAFGAAEQAACRRAFDQARSQQDR